MFDKKRFISKREKRKIDRNLNDRYYVMYVMKFSDKTWGNPLKSDYGLSQLKKSNDTNISNKYK